MFVDNSQAAQQKMFTIESEMDARLKKKLSKHWSNMFYQKVFLAIDEEQFAPLYCEDNGRPNFPVNILAGLDILKELYQITDRQLFDRYYFDISFRRALGLADFNEHILAEKTLYNFRAALAEYDRGHSTSLMEPIFKLLRDDIIQELGLATGKQRTDSTLIGANIKKLSRLALFHKVLSNLVRDMKAFEISIPKHIEDIVKEDEDNYTYHLKSEEYEEATIKIARCIYRLVSAHIGDWRISPLESYGNAARLISEQCRVSKRKKVFLKPPDEVSSSSLQNPADPDATYRKKNNEKHRGYSAHVTETCDTENKMQVITDVEVVKNNVDDAKVLAEHIEQLKEETGLDTIITDGGFVSDDMRTVCAENEVQLVTTAIRGTSSDETTEKFTSLDFKINKESGEIETCPMGISPRSVSMKGNTSVANFDPKKCSRCKKQSKCPAYYSEKLSRYVIDDKRRWLDERQELLKTKEYRELCGLRPPVEGLMSRVKPKYLRGRILFRRLERVKNRMILRVIGINFKRFRAYKSDSFDFFDWVFIKNISWSACDLFV